MSKGAYARALARGKCPNCGRDLIPGLHTCEKCRVKQADRDGYRHRVNRIRVERDPEPVVEPIVDLGPSVWDLLPNLCAGIDAAVREAS
jgi:hypothetical protein